MCAQELVALFRFSNKSCPSCNHIIGKYEKSLTLSSDDMKHLEN